MDEFLEQLTKAIPTLRRYAYALVRDSSLADDLVQDCLEKGLAHRAQWRGEGNLKTWLYRILSNIHLNQIRADKGNFLKTSDTTSEAVLTAAEAQSPANQIDHLYLQDLEAAIAQLPEEQKQILLLICLEGFSYQEAAKTLELPLGTVMSRLSRARETLRHKTSGTGTDEAAANIRRIK
ncbi:sigma-70 family RNA polymerase sigma factor [Kiloniella laminariae]|uniref:Sigma-70 family RNA polymerase sigma factor n=1 Tax=Kiloniella laminariae TaxID=454162 RepID=A0ABT4LM85_9PROT|nr:sigma-70 family RNA polymerase sigma factor [Kiloniella laminariae]MCZ4282219.1 sigma-70 family RNA polymerase sigma factor [Kiloniella laminariae]